MYEPILRNSALKRYSVNGFGGVNETEAVKDNEFVYTENIVDNFPVASVRPHLKRHDTVAADIRRVVMLDKLDESYLFTGIAEDNVGVRFYYKNTLQPFDGSYSYSLAAESVCRMNGKILIFPDKVCFDENEPEKGIYDMTRSVSIENAKFYSEESDGVITNYISGGDFSVFRRGESVVISGCSEEGNNVVRVDKAVGSDIVSAIVESIEDDKLYLLCYTASGEDAVFENVISACIVGADIPDMNRVCCQNNRLWGTDADGSMIYASKLGDPFDFNSFAGISTDSWWGQVASVGEFVGIYPYQNHIYAFKNNCIHEIYGDKPSNFKMPYSVKCGTIDSDSITEIGGVMYFTASDGVYAYNGGVPTKVSQKITVTPKTAKAAVWGDSVFVILDGEMYVFNTEKSSWYRIGECAKACYADENGLFFIVDGVLAEWNKGKEVVHWCVQTREFLRNETEQNGCVNVWLKIKLADGACAAVNTSVDGGKFKRWGVIRGDTGTGRVPVRFRKCDTFSIRVEGMGDAKIYGIEFENYNGGYSIPSKM